MRVRGTALGAGAVDLPTRRMALRAGLGLVATAAMPISALAHGSRAAHATHATHSTHPSHTAYAAHALIKKPSRELSFLNLHTGERIRAEYIHNGQVVPSAMHAIAVVMRDHCNNKIHPIDPRLLDIAHNLQSHVGSHAVIQVVCGYRSPETNAMMHEASAGVAAHSLHIQGKAMDIRLPGTRLGSLRKTAVALKMGGVGYYPEDDFVHIDSGEVRRWVG